jgi:thioesterase domain-containing protein/acyl carrier protein
MDGAIKPFAECVAKTPCHAPVIPFISNVSGTWITADQAQDPMYWASHIRNTVNFSNGAKQLIDNPDTIFIEIGPGSSLYTLVNMQSPSHKPVTAIQTIPHVKQQQHDMEMFYSALGKLWIAGAKINWGNCYGNEQRYKISLPTYPFERQRYWVEPAIITSSKSVPQSTIKNKTTRSNTSQSVSSKSIKHSTHPRPRLSYEYIAPSTDLEKQLVEIWQTILGIEPIGINDNFFDLGGHSLLAVQMFSQIQKKTGQNLSLATLFTASTIKKISLLITKLLEGTTLSSETSSFVSEKNPWKHVVPIKSSGTLPPFFCVHGVGGNVLNYYQFVPFLDVEQPLYGLQCLGLDGISTPFKNVQLMASKYVSEIRKVQPHGPYYLGGGSMGGLVAFEIAQQLVAMEEQIGILLMFDSVCIKLARSGSRPTEPATVQSTDQSSPKKSILSRIRHSIWCRVRDGYKMAVCKKYNLMGKPIPHELRYWLVEQKNLAITTEYFPKPYNGLITMFRATLNTGCSDPNRGWGSVAKGGIKFFDFACEHETMVEEVDVVKKLGEVLRKTR